MNTSSRVSPGGGLVGRLRRAAAGLLDAWLPASCIVCDRPRSDRLCDDCEAALPGVRAARCPRCGLVLPGPGDATPARCAGCDDDPPAFTATVVLADYAAPLDRLVHALKFGRDASLARPLGRALAQRLAFAWPDGPPPLVTAIPLSTARLAERGFNQSLEIARALARAALAARPSAAGAHPQRRAGRDAARRRAPLGARRGVRDASRARRARGDRRRRRDDHRRDAARRCRGAARCRSRACD
ncbi:MAG: double zinc ribbon domain-containing protein [Burkholderiaceae bacterium]